jgi:hypothetical protein
MTDPPETPNNPASTPEIMPPMTRASASQRDAEEHSTLYIVNPEERLRVRPK